MAELRLNFLAGWATANTRSDSAKARKFVKESYKKAGGRPTAELERIYGEYVKYKRAKSASRKD